MRVPDTHEAIITHETFERVQELLKCENCVKSCCN
ncbi:hypothetical protein D3Z60_13210 [Lachnospiraceae bacterium]|nr:hypothetical protein [Lachnospiraceae bacterium]